MPGDGFGGLPRRVSALKPTCTLSGLRNRRIGSVTRAHDGLTFYQRNQLLGERLTGARLPEREIAWSPERAACSDRVSELRAQLSISWRIHDQGRRGCNCITRWKPDRHFSIRRSGVSASSLPYDLRLRGGELKTILREIARRRVGDRVRIGRQARLQHSCTALDTRQMEKRCGKHVSNFRAF